MSASINYRGNTIETKEEDNEMKLLINGEAVQVTPSNDLPGKLQSPLSFMPAADHLQLGKYIVDQQLALTEPMLDNLVDDQNE